MTIDTAKGGLFSGPFNSTGLDANVRALLIDFCWTTPFVHVTESSHLVA